MILEYLVISHRTFLILRRIIRYNKCYAYKTNDLFNTFFPFLPLHLIAEPLVIYSHRHYEADETLFKAFTEQTGIEVKVLKAGAN